MDTAVETLKATLKVFRLRYAKSQEEIDMHRRMIEGHDRRMSALSKEMGELEAALRALGAEVPAAEEPPKAAPPPSSPVYPMWLGAHDYEINAAPHAIAGSPSFFIRDASGNVVKFG